MSLLDRWVANTKRVLAKDKNTGSEYEFESIFPDGAPDGTAFSAENMNKIIDAVNGLDESKAQPGGIATLNSSGKLAQMPTAADVGAEPKLIYADYSGQVVEMNGFKSHLIVKKIGHLVVVKNYIDKSSGTYSTSGARVATLPAAVAPSSILYFASTAYNFDGEEYAAHVTISANGLVITYAPASAAIAIIDAVYFV